MLFHIVEFDHHLTLDFSRLQCYEWSGHIVMLGCNSLQS